MLSSDQRLTELRRELLERFDIPVRADDELLALAATMLLTLEKATERLSAEQLRVLEHHRQIIADAATEALRKGRAVAIEELRSSGAATADQIAASVEHAAKRLEYTAQETERAARLSLCLSVGFAAVAAASATCPTLRSSASATTVTRRAAAQRSPSPSSARRSSLRSDWHWNSTRPARTVAIHSGRTPAFRSLSPAERTERSRT